jgi:nucleoside phosphorylase
MPLEMEAIVAAFGLTRSGEGDDAAWTGRLGNSDVTAIHIGMGPPLTRAATRRLFETAAPGHRPVDHVMIAGICGGLSPDIEVGTLLNPEVLIDHTSGQRFRHHPPGDRPQEGNIITTEGVSLDPELCRSFLEQGCLGVDMESAALAEVCEEQGCAWSVYRCIGDRPVDGLLDERIVAATNQDGSPNMDEIVRLLEEDPSLADKLGKLAEDSTRAARLAAEAAARGCLALDD